MTKHLLDMHGDHCRYPRWNDNGQHQGNRLVPCGQPGYPYCERHAAIVRSRREVRDAAPASWQNYYLTGSR